MTDAFDRSKPTALTVVSEPATSMADHAVLQQLLETFPPGADQGQVAQRLIAAFGSVGGVLAAGRDSLTSLMGQPAASRLSTIYAVFQHVLRERLAERPVIGSWTALEKYLLVTLRHERVEKLLVLFLDRANGLICDEIMQEATVADVVSYPRQIAKRALELDASAVILVHNRPSGDPTPSRADVDLTRQVAAALAPLDIITHDHAIVGRNDVVSLRRTGAI